MNDLLLHDTTKQQLQQLSAAMPHATIVYGPDQIGKKSAIQSVIADRHSDERDKICDENWSQLLVVTSPADRKSISIEQIRELNQFLTLTDEVTRYVIIDDAHTMTIPAQNAFLKNFEQPQTNVHIVMITHQLNRLIPTIRSRAQLVRFQPPHRDQISQWAQQEFNDSYDQSLVHVSEGSPGRLKQLLDDGKRSRRTLDEITQAKQILSATTVERLAKISSLKSDRTKSERIISHLKVMSKSAMRSVDNPSAISSWALKAQRCEQALTALNRNANTRLVWLRLMVNL